MRPLPWPPVVEGIDVEPVSAWLQRHVAGAVAPFAFERIGGGRSNLTFAVTGAADTRFVLRRPPLHHVLATAHDMTREHRAISAMGPTAVPVPEALGLCIDEGVNGAPFYVMSLVDGVVVDSVAAAEQVGPADTGRRCPSGSPTCSPSCTASTSTPSGSATSPVVTATSSARSPAGPSSGTAPGRVSCRRSTTSPSSSPPASREQQGVAVVHGDYRFGNCITDVATGDIKAVLDWELCTLGDPLADVGYVGSQWAAGDGDGRHNDPTGAGGFGTFDDFVERYATASSRDLSAIDFYVAFQLWRSAIIIEGVYARYLGGAYGGQELGAELDVLRDAPVELIAQAQSVLARLW